MARYTGPSCRLCRRAGEKLMLKGSRCLTKCTLDKRPSPPGNRSSKRRARISDRGIQLRSKQRVRYAYGLNERQFRLFFMASERQKGITGDNLLVRLERRLDNVVYRLGMADSRAQGRQLILHGHILVNDHRVTIPSYLVQEGDIIRWREGSKRNSYYLALAEGIKGKTVPGWLSLDRNQIIGRVVSLPTPEDVELKFDMATVVEYYSR